MDTIDHLKTQLESQIEKRFWPHPHYMSRQMDISSEMRSVVITWFEQIQRDLKLSSQTVTLASNIMDRFLSKYSIDRSHLQLVGGVSVLIASKSIDDDTPLYSHKLADLCKYQYSVKLINATEARICKDLEYRFHVPNPFAFIEDYQILYGKYFLDKHDHLFRRLVFTLLRTHLYNFYAPSFISIACLYAMSRIVPNSIPDEFVNFCLTFDKSKYAHIKKIGCIILSQYQKQVHFEFKYMY